MFTSTRAPLRKPSWLVLLPALVLPVKWTYSTSVVCGTNLIRAPVSTQRCTARRTVSCWLVESFEMSYGMTPSGHGSGFAEFGAMCAGSDSAQLGHVVCS